MNVYVEQKRFVRDIQGAPASILLILLLSGRSLTRNDLVDATNYSKDSVSAGIRRLDEYKLLNYDGKHQGWSLSPRRARQLGIFDALLQQGHSGVFLESESQSNESDALIINGSNTSTRLAQRQQKSLFVNSAAEEIGGVGDETKEKAIFAFSPTADHDHDLINADLLINHYQDHEKDDQSAADHDQHEPDEAKTVSLLALQPLMRRIGIREPVFSRWNSRNVDPEIVLAWYWWALCQEWLTDNKVGYVVKVIENPKAPPPEDFLAAARWWYCLTPDGRDVVLETLLSLDSWMLRGQPYYRDQLPEDLFDALSSPPALSVVATFLLMAETSFSELELVDSSP